MYGIDPVPGENAIEGYIGIFCGQTHYIIPADD